MNNKKLSIVLILITAALVIHIVQMRTEGARLDFTETKLFSLTEGTHQILDKMKTEAVKPVDIKLYFSYTAGKTLPKFIKNFITYEEYVHNLLREYERYSDGKLRISVVDPKPDSDDAEDAEDYRLDGKPINSEGDKFYFGLVFETQTGSRDVIEFLWPEQQETVEYEISKKLYNLLWPKKKRIALISSLDPLPDNNPYMQQMMMMQGKQPPEPWTAIKVLEESYTVTRLSDVDTIPKSDYDLLMVIHPKNLGDKTLWAIDEWVTKGGDALVFLDPYSIEDQAPSNPQQPFAQLQYKPASDLGKLMDAWGLKIGEDLFAVDYDLATKRPVDQTGTVYQVINDLTIDDKQAAKAFNQEVPIFSGLTNVRFFLAGTLSKADGASGEFTPLVTTTDQGDALKIIPGFGGDAELAYTDLQDPNKLLDKYKPTGKQTLAYLISGQFKSAFPSGTSFPKETPQLPPGLPPGFQMPTPEGAEMITKPATPADQLAKGRVIVFADVDFITNQLAFQNSMFGAQAANDNYKVLLNSVDYLLGAKELMAVRSKKNIRRPFEKFDEIEAEADRKSLDEEQKIRADIELFQNDLRAKQSSQTEKNAVLFEKKVSDEVETLNTKIRDAEKRLREIRKDKRAVLEGAESFIWYFVLGLMPLIVCGFGIASFLRRRSRQMSVRARK